MAVISVLIPTHNRPDLVLEAIASVERQDVPVECIVENDPQSTGQSATVNRAFKRSTGDYITVLDDDDYFVRPDALRLLQATLDAHPEAAAAYSLPEYVDAFGKPIETPPSVLAWAEAHPVVTQETIQRDGFRMHGGGILHRRAWWEQAGPWDETLPVCQEWEYRLRLIAMGALYVLCPVVTVAYRQHKGQMSARGGRCGRRSAAGNAVRRELRQRFAVATDSHGGYQTTQGGTNE